jgi:outer membrane protein assembly factor BamB
MKHFLLYFLLAVCGIARADFSFVHITDTHFTAAEAAGSNAAKNVELFKEISATKPAFVVNTGDVVEVGTPAEYAVYKKALQSLTVPHYDAPGNHDVRWNPLGKEGFTQGAKQPLYQSWDWENIHFVLLDSTVLLQHWAHFDQAMLDWLKADLEKAGRDKPIVIGFHHWIGRPTVQADNERALIDLLAPYNVRLFLIGHGHADIQWSINGVPAIMSKGLYQGSYHRVEVDKEKLRVLRRTATKTTPEEILSIPLARPAAVDSSIAAQAQNKTIFVQAARGNLPADAKLTFRLNNGAPNAMNFGENEWRGEAPQGAVPGEIEVKVEAQLPDNRAFQRFARVRVAAPHAPLWTTNLGGAIQSKLVRAGDGLFVSTMGGDVVCLNPQSGAEKWRFKTGGAVFSTPLVIEETVYFGSADYFVYALNARDGALKWRTKTGGAVFAGAALAQGILCIASVDKKIYGLDATTGQIRWTAPVEGMVQSQAATDGTRFFVGGWDNYFRAIEATTGRELWKNKFGRAFYFSPAIGSPTVREGRVFVSSNDGVLHAMNAETGQLLWEVNGLALGYSGPLLRDGKIYNGSLTDTGRVFCFNAETGAKIWETPTGSVIYDSSCAFGGGNVFISCVNGIFSALNAQTGAVAWQYQLAPGHVLASPATDEARVYIGSMNGDVTAFALNAHQP